MGERFIAPESLTVDVWAISDQNAIKPTVNYMPVRLQLRSERKTCHGAGSLAQGRRVECKVKVKTIC